MARLLITGGAGFIRSHLRSAFGGWSRAGSARRPQAAQLRRPSRSTSAPLSLSRMYGIEHAKSDI